MERWRRRFLTSSHTWRARVPLTADRLRALRHRWHRVLVLSALAGLSVGVAVAAYDWIVAEAFLERVMELPDAWQVLVPVAGVLLATAVLRSLGRPAMPAVSDDYLRAYHGRPRDASVRGFVTRIGASIATLGSGAAMGFEGPAIFIGSSIGSWYETRFKRFFSERDRHTLLVAGAAAGVAAIFKAPAAGAIFALEVPYQQDTASHAVVPALVASAASYLTYVVFNGTGRLFDVAGSPAFDAKDLAGALALGLLCGVGARVFSRMLRSAKQSRRLHPRGSLVVAVCGIAVVGTAALLLFSDVLTIGPGYTAITWSLDPDRAVELVVALFALHALATVFAVAGGGVGGLFIPLFVQGWLLGRVAEGIVSTKTSLFPVIGAAAFLGAGYRTPITAVVFVAETTGRAGFVVPALIATAVAQLVMGSRSVTDQQLPRRVGRLERRLEQPVSVAIEPVVARCDAGSRFGDVRTAAATSDIPLVAVYDGDRYLGVIDVRELVCREETTAAAAALVAAEYPTARAQDTLRQVLVAMRHRGVEVIPVLDTGGALLGMVRASSIIADGSDAAPDPPS